MECQLSMCQGAILDDLWCPMLMQVDDQIG